MKKHEDEKRRNKRISYPQPASTSFIVMGDFIHPPNTYDVKGEILDVSNGGMKIRVDGNPPEKGSVLRVLVPVHVAPDVQAVIPVLTQVRWVKGSSNEDHQVGIRFMA
ncbi:MAG: PilZ domain-containing protein [Planctomycetes bacterium]|nr:PilZ domain-containing protein [Planctomycetota bacterium]